MSIMARLIHCGIGCTRNKEKFRAKGDEVGVELEVRGAEMDLVVLRASGESTARE